MLTFSAFRLLTETEQRDNSDSKQLKPFKHYCEMNYSEMKMAKTKLDRISIVFIITFDKRSDTDQNNNF